MSSSICTNCGRPILEDARYCMYCGSPISRNTHLVLATYRQRALARLLDAFPILAVYSLVAAFVGAAILSISFLLQELGFGGLDSCFEPLEEDYGCASVIIIPIVALVAIVCAIVMLVLLAIIIGIAIAIVVFLGLLFFSAFVLALKGIWLRLFPFGHGTTFGKRRLGMRVIKKSGEPAGAGRMFVREVVIPWNPVIWGIIPIIWLWLSWDSYSWSALVYGLSFLIFWLLDFLWPLWDDNRQALHDKIVGTLVVMPPDTGPGNPPGAAGGDSDPTDAPTN